MKNFIQDNLGNTKKLSTGCVTCPRWYESGNKVMTENSSRVRISIIVPTHKRRRYLIRLLDSLKAQTCDYRSFEVIVVHNYTPDGTEQAVAGWIKNNALAIRYFRKNNRSPAASRDFGARIASGEYLGFIDDDCVATENWIQSAIDLFDRENSGAMNHVKEDGMSSLGLIQGRTLPMPDQPRHLLEKTVHVDRQSPFFENCNIFYTKEAFSCVGGYSEEFLEKFYGEDTDLGWKVQQAGFRKAFCPEALVHHEVFSVSLLQWLREPTYFRNLPYLVRKYPPLRDYMHARYFLLKDTMLFYGVVIGLIVSPLSVWLAILFALPYLIYRYRNGGRYRSPLVKAARAILGIPRTMVMCATLAIASIRSKSVLL